MNFSSDFSNRINFQTVTCNIPCHVSQDSSSQREIQGKEGDPCEEESTREEESSSDKEIRQNRRSSQQDAFDTEFERLAQANQKEGLSRSLIFLFATCRLGPVIYLP